jgi:hypothetical protein
MKKFSFSILILVVFSLHLHAQIQIGVRAGVHWSTIRGQRAINDWSLSPGFILAVPIQVPIANRWSIRVEPSVIRKSWQSKVDYITALGQPAGTGKMVQHYEVAELPLLISYRRKVNNRLSYYGLLGPSVGYVLGGRLKVTDGEGAPIFSDHLIFERRTETGIWGGGGVEISMGQLIAFLDARYQYGLSAPKFYVGGATRGFTFSVGCWLPFKKKPTISKS